MTEVPQDSAYPVAVSDAAKRALARVHFGQRLTAAAAAGAFAGLMTIVGGQLTGEHIQQSALLLTAALPLLAFQFMHAAPERAGTADISMLMKLFGVLGILCALCGLGFLLERAHPGCGVLFGVVSLACAFVSIRAEDRLKHRRQT
ncbi:MAG: hypothetical protein ACFCVE_05015 [Phycisphaerae bacterium]